MLLGGNQYLVFLQLEKIGLKPKFNRVHALTTPFAKDSDEAYDFALLVAEKVR